MSVESDDDRAAFFDVDEFGTTVSWNHGGTLAAVTGILSSAGDHLGAAGGMVESIGGQSQFLCRAIDLPSGAGQGDTLQAGTNEYTVKALLPDGTDMVAAELEKRA